MHRRRAGRGGIVRGGVKGGGAGWRVGRGDVSAADVEQRHEITALRLRARPDNRRRAREPCCVSRHQACGSAL
ncbi:protein of unknown function [Paraburkholderia kururiensis]